METKMNRYQCSIDHFTGAKTLFEVEATDKAAALIAAREYARKHIQWGGNFFENTIKVIKKIQKKSPTTNSVNGSGDFERRNENNAD